MKQEGERRPIIIRKKRSTHQASHGTWKIAYADFMTALMAFFLVMWLLANLNAAQKKQVSQYFQTPLKVALAGGDKSSASDSAIPGGGDDPTHAAGEVRLTTPHAKSHNDQTRRLERLREKLLAQIKQDPQLNAMSSQLAVDLVPDGLRIRISDSKQRPMFDLGSARLRPEIARLLMKIAPTLATVKNKITLTGHTDDLSYASGPASFGNWELSADRANAARRALVAGGMPADKLLRVIAAADTDRIPGAPADSPLNRRITILLLNKQAEQRLESPVDDGPPITPSTTAAIDAAHTVAPG